MLIRERNRYDREMSDLGTLAKDAHTVAAIWSWYAEDPLRSKFMDLHRTFPECTTPGPSVPLPEGDKYWAPAKTGQPRGPKCNPAPIPIEQLEFWKKLFPPPYFPYKTHPALYAIKPTEFGKAKSDEAMKKMIDAAGMTSSNY